MAEIQVMVQNPQNGVEDLDNDWDPRQEDFNNVQANRYFDGPGADMDVDLQRPSQKRDAIYTLHVANLPNRLNEVGLENLFLNFGTPVNIRSKRDYNRSYAFVDYASYREAERAIRELDRRPPFNLRVTFARSKQEKNRLQKQQEQEDLILRQMSNVTSFDMNSNGQNFLSEPSKYVQPRGMGRGAGRGTPILQAYLQGRPGQNNQAQVSWTQGTPDIVDPGHHIYDPVFCRNQISNMVEQGLYVSLSDTARKVSFGRGHIPPPRVNKNEQKSKWEISDGIYRMGEDILVPMGKCSVCSTSTALKCLQCGTFYCSRKCQKQDYPQHATACTPKQDIDIVITSQADQRSVKFAPLIPKAEPQSVTGDASWGRPEHSVLHVLAPGKTAVFMLTSKQAPNCLFGPLSCQDICDETTEMVVSLPAVLSNTPQDPSFRPMEGQLVGVFGEESWWRGYVLSISSDMYSVALCDKGSIESLNISNIRRLPSDFLGLTELGVKCTVVKSHVTDSISDLCDKTFKEDQHYTIQVEGKDGSVVSGKVIDHSNQVICDVVLERWDPVLEQWSLNCVSLETPCRVVLASYHNQHALYVRPVGKVHRERFFSLLQRVAAVHVTSGPLGRAPYRGEMVACRFTDGNFYRAVVIKESTDTPGEYSVAFVDYGNNGSVPASDMKALPVDLKMHPCCAVKVRLRDVEDRPLTENAVQFLNSVLEREMELRLEGPIEDGAVELFLSDGTSFNRKLSCLLQPRWKQAINNGDDIFGGNIFELKHMKVLPLLESEKMKENTPARILLLDLLGDGRIAACPAYNKVLAQVVTTLSSQINEYCGSQDDSARYNPRSGEVCLARFRDGMWYRAVCVMPLSSHTSEVTFLDYGNTEKIDHVDIRRIVQDFVHSPILVSFCHVKGVPENPSAEHIVALREQLVSNKVYDIIVVKSLGVGEYLLHFPDLQLPS